MASFARIFKRQALPFAENGNVSLKRYIAYYCLFNWLVSIAIAVVLGLILPINSHAVAGANEIVSAFLASYIVIRMFYKAQARFLSLVEYKRIVKCSVLWLIMTYIGFLLIVGLGALFISHFDPNNDIARAIFNPIVILIVMLGLGFLILMTWLFTSLGYRWAMLSIQKEQIKKAKKAGKRAARSAQT